MKNDCVNIIVPVYNVEKYLDECICSILNQTFSQIRLIMVNDGSKDSSLSICEKWKQKDNRIIVIDQVNQGVSSARNTGLKYAQGKYVLFVDADDVLDETVVEELVRNYESGYAVGIAVDCFDTSMREVAKSLSDTVKCTYRQLMDRRNGYFCWGILYDYDLINNNKLSFCEELSNLEDVVWNIQYGMYIDNAKIVNICFYHYRIREGSITMNCHDYQWQIKSWLKAYNCVRKIPVLCEKHKYIDKEKRRCKNNIYAEVFEGNINWKELKKWLIEFHCQKNFSKFEFIIYRLIFILRGKFLNKVYKCILDIC